MGPSKESSKKRRTKKTTEEHGDWSLAEAVLSSPHVRTVYLYGPPGLGKTYAAFHIGRVQGEVPSVTMTEDTPAAELRGHYVMRGNGEFVWQDGSFTDAMRRGMRLVVNEVTHAAPEAMTFLHPVLESFETARLTLPTKETVRPAPGFHVVCTDNLPPDELPEALRDRFDCIVHIREPHPDAVAKLDPVLRHALQRGLALDTDRRVSLRGWMGLQRLAPEFGFERACLAVFGADRGAQIYDAIQLAGKQEPGSQS